jgi:Family of unknown function (DUF6165)
MSDSGKVAVPGFAYVPVPYGELVDKITILEIKCQRMVDARENVKVRAELEILRRVEMHCGRASQDVRHLTNELRLTNEKLWDLEDRIRDYELAQEFGTSFIAVARDIYKTNDQRAIIKHRLNELAGATGASKKLYRQTL